MADATLPAPRSSSVAPATGDGSRTDSSSGGEGDSDASLIPSTPLSTEVGSTASQGRVENKQRRKRTSAKDQAILEAEYAANPKPNKAARAIIVEKVDLNEKEVQIWFQNRRQINRRKSRPLLPHEIAAYGIHGLPMIGSDLVPAMIFSSSPSMPASIDETGRGMSSQVKAMPAIKPVREGYTPNVESEKRDGEAIGKAEGEQLSPTSSLAPLQRSESDSGVPSTESTLVSLADSVIKSFTSTPGYLANRWNSVNSLLSTPTPSEPSSFETPAVSIPHMPSSCPERIGLPSTSSKVRLSMSMDGKAELIESESPPHRHPARPASTGPSLPQSRMRGLQRSQSARQFGPLPKVSPPTAFVPRLKSGRSRDARQWEFCCDPDARDELTTQAENESSGSAVAAISLLRSTSQKALKSNSNKRNAPATKHDFNTTEGKRPKLGRAMSSLARMQHSEKPKKSSQPAPGKDGALMRSPSGDSDKENWVPGTNSQPARRRPLPSSSQGKLPSTSTTAAAILGEKSLIVSTSANTITNAYDLSGPKNKRRRAGAQLQPQIFEDQGTDASAPGEEVEKFMRGEVSPGKKGDLDCIQGLLSLSQGNWR